MKRQRMIRDPIPLKTLSIDSSDDLIQGANKSLDKKNVQKLQKQVQKPIKRKNSKNCFSHQKLTSSQPPKLLCANIKNCTISFESLKSIKDVRCFINRPTQTKCKQCGQFTQTIQRMKYCKTTYLCAALLLVTTGVCCFWPFVIKKCQNKQLICIICCAKKQIIPPSLCGNSQIVNQ